jgi:archaemetzincin
MITLVPVGEINLAILGALGDRLEQFFAQEARIQGKMDIPEGSWNARRGQYLSAHFLIHLPRSIGHDRVLGVADVDMYAVGYDFVFGEAELNRDRRAVISVTRLRQEFYGKRHNQRLFEERMAKEAVHELGHTWGLVHCSNPRCVMHFTTSVEETDYKRVEYCALCQTKLKHKIKVYASVK